MRSGYTIMVKNNILGFEAFTAMTPLYPQKLALNFADKRRSLSRYSSITD
jgi:hypothetical protein